MSRKWKMVYRGFWDFSGLVVFGTFSLPEQDHGAMVKYFLTNAWCEKQ